jgi:hypothetical protein
MEGSARQGPGPSTSEQVISLGDLTPLGRMAQCMCRHVQHDGTGRQLARVLYILTCLSYFTDGSGSNMAHRTIRRNLATK